jgi:hypothetical protein
MRPHRTELYRRRKCFEGIRRTEEEEYTCGRGTFPLWKRNVSPVEEECFPWVCGRNFHRKGERTRHHRFCTTWQAGVY